MLKALRAVMIVFGAIGIIAGLFDVIDLQHVVKLYGFQPVADPVRWIMALGGAGFIAVECGSLFRPRPDPTYFLGEVYNDKELTFCCGHRLRARSGLC